MLAAHLALTALTVAPANGSAVLPPFAAEAATLSAQQMNSVAAETQIPEPAFGGTDTATLSAPAEPVDALDQVASPVAAKAVPDPAASLDDIDLAAPKAFPDPLEPINRVFYAINQPIDRLVLRPAAMVYKTIVPKPARDGARNAISNFGEPIVFINDLLQLRPDRAIRTVGRFLVNSILGLGGLFDIAKREPFYLKHHNNGFADTLGYYGMGPVIYVYLPILGPTNLRDSAGHYGDSYFMDRNLHNLIHPDEDSPYFRTQPKLGTAGTAMTVVDGLDQRAENDDDLRNITEDSVDPYAALRASYLQDRAGEIAELKAKQGEAPKTEGFEDPLVDPEAPKP